MSSDPTSPRSSWLAFRSPFPKDSTATTPTQSVNTPSLLSLPPGMLPATPTPPSDEQPSEGDILPLPLFPAPPPPVLSVHDNQRVGQLVEVWGQFRSLFAKRKLTSDRLNSAKTLLRAFVVTYNPRWSMWNPDLIPTLWDGSEPADKPPISSIPPLDSSLVSSLVKMLKEYTMSLSQAVATASQIRISSLHPLSLEFPAGLEIVCLFSILSRAYCNIQELCSEDDTIYCFSKLIKLVTVCLNSLPDVQGKGNILESPDIYLQVLLGYSFITMEYLLSRDHGWKRFPYETTEGKHSIQQADDEQCYTARVKMQHIGSLIILLKKTLELLTEQGSSVGFSGSRYHLLCHILNLIGALAFRNPPVAIKMLESGLIETLLSLLPGLDGPWFSLTDCQTIFNIQLLVFQVLGFSFGPSPELAFRFANGKGWQKYFNFLRWTLQHEPQLSSLSSSHPYLQFLSSSFTDRAYLPSVHDFLPADPDADQTFLSQFFRPIDIGPLVTLPLPPPHPSASSCIHIDLLMKTLSVVCTNTIFPTHPSPSSPCPTSSSPTEHSQEESKGSIRRFFSRRRDTSSDMSFLSSSEPSPSPSPDSKDVVPSESLGPLYSFSYAALRQFLLFLIGDPFESPSSSTLLSTSSGAEPVAAALFTHPYLGFAFIRLLCDLIHHNPSSSVQLFRRISLWQTISACLFSPHLSSPPPTEFMLFIEHHLVLLRCVATIPNLPTIDEIDSLLEWISRNSQNYPLLYQLIQSLSKILESNTVATCQSLASSHLLQVFTPLLLHLRTSQTQTSEANPLKESRAVVQRVHFAAMGFLTRLFDASPENALNAAISDSFLEEFFGHFLIPELRRYLRPLLTSILKLSAERIAAKIYPSQSGSTADLTSLDGHPPPSTSRNILAPSASMPTVTRSEGRRASVSRTATKMVKPSMALPSSSQYLYLKPFREFLKLITHVHQLGQYDILNDLLRICTAVIEEPSHGQPEPSRAAQRCFREANGIQTFLNLLQTEEDPDRLPQLCITILRLLLSLLRANPKSKERLRSLGTDYFHNLLRKCLDADSKGLLSMSLPILLLSLLVDGDFDGETRPLFQNPDILPLIIRLCEHLPPAQSCRLLDLITPLFEKYTLNKSIGCQIRLIFVLLGMVPRLAEKPDHQTVLVKLMFLVQILGIYSIRVSELKRIFHLLKTLPRSGPDSPLILLLGALHNMALCKNSGPDVFFNFDGGKSGLQLPQLDRLPQHGYSFTTWIRVESFEDPTGAPKFQPRLFSFLNRQGMGIEAWFSDKLVETGGRNQYGSVLSISCIGSNGKPYHITFDQHLFKPLVWTCVSICHSNNTRFPWKDSDCKLYIDGQLRQKVALKYPVLTQPLDLCRIGSNAEVQSSRLLLYRESSFYGQIGTIYMFEDVLNQTHLKAIYSLGPNYSSTFQPSDVSLFESQASRSSFKLPGILFDGTIASKLLLCYNCKAQEGKLILDNHPERVNSNAEFQMNAKILGSLNSCNTHDVSNQISCLGGISVLLPLFSHLDVCFSAPLTQSDMELAQLLLIQILSVLRETLISSEVNQVDIVRIDGFAIISLLLRRASPDLLSSPVLQMLQEFVAQIRLPELAQQAYNNLFFDFRIWIRTKLSLQLDLLSMLLGFVKSSPYLRRLFPIQAVLDVIRVFYWEKLTGTSEQLRHYFAADPQQRITRPDSASLATIRQSFISILSVLVMHTTNPEELIRPFYGFFLDCPDRVLLTELLTFFLQLVIDDVNGFKMLTASYFGSIFFLLLLDNFDEKIRMLCLRALAYLIPSTVTSNLVSESSPDLHASIAQVSDQPSYLSFSAGLAQRLRRSKRDNQFAYADRILVTFPYTSSTINTLFAILVGSPMSESIELSDDLAISNTSILPLIFRLLLAGDVSHCLSVLQDLYLLLSNNYANRSAFIQCRVWQRWLFDLLTNPQLYTDGPSFIQVIHDLIFNIFRILFIHQILYEKFGWRIIDQTYCILVDYGQRGLLNPERTIKLILKRVYPALLSEAEKLQSVSKRDGVGVFSSLYQKSSSPLLMNLINSLIRSIQFVLFQPGVAPSRRTDALTSDDSSSQMNAESPESRLQRANSESWLFSLSTFSSLTLLLDLDFTDTPDIRPRPFLSNLSAHLIPDKKAPSLLPRYSTPIPNTPDYVPRDSGEGHGLVSSHGFPESSPETERLHTSHDSFPSNPELLHAPSPSSPLPQFWQDEQFAIHICDLIARLDLFHPELAYNSEIRTAIAELSLRSLLLSVHLVEYDCGANSSVAHIIRKLVQSDVMISGQIDISDSRLQFVLHRFLQVLAQPQIDTIREKTCVIVSKFVLRRLLPLLQEYIDPSDRPELEELADRGTLATLRAAFGSHPPEKWEILMRYLRIMANQFISVDLPVILDPILKSRRKVYESVMKMISKLDKRECSEERIVTNELRSLREQLLGSERMRRNTLTTSNEEHSDKTNFQWRNILRNLTNERGPWGSKQMATNVHWKLDKTENFSRMRVKLRRNYKFDPHLNKASDYVLTAAAPALSFTGGLKVQQDYVPDSVEPSNEAQSSDMGNLVSLSLSVQSDLSEDPQSFKQQAIDESTQQSFRILLTVPCQLVSPLKQTAGEFQITTNHLTFRADTANVLDEYHIRKTLSWPLFEIREVHLRRFRLRRTALEIFFVNQTNAFFNFNKTDRNRIFHKIVSLRPPNLVSYESGSPEEILAKSGLIKEWQQKQISNFEYLMRLNTIAGRTYNDLSQYPIFPWVIADYESTSLDFNDPKIYRDLTKPIGALNPQRLGNLLERYNSWCDPDTPKFLYGSHYSTSGTVLYYLLRMEPFTTYALGLQGDKFDRADRLFDSIAGTWNNVLVNPSDVKELIPEFFYNPDFLVNSNGFDFGTKQNGIPLGDVTLPPWASSPEEFVRINRIALESDYVTQHLPAWIDLIFGFKQRGKEAELAHNVFYFLTYEGAVDLDAIEDEVKRSATEDQIEYYGQTPAQLLRRPHPSCDLRNAQARQPIFSNSRLLSLNTHFLPVSNEAIIFIGVPGSNLSADLSAHLGITDRLVTVDRSRMPGAHRWALIPGSSQCYTCELDSLLATRRRIGLPFASDIAPSSSQFAVTNDGKMILSCGHWDNSFKFSLVENSRLVQSVLRHKDVVTCLALGSDGKTLITGSKDTTLIIWRILTKSGTYKVDEMPLHILCGHNDEVTCVDLSVELDVSVSGSKDGTAIIHSLRKGAYVRSIYNPSGRPFNQVSLSGEQHIVLYSRDDAVLRLYSINGKLLGTISTNQPIFKMICTKKYTNYGDYLITGSHSLIEVRALYNLQLVWTLDTTSEVRELSMTSDERHLLVGLKDGKMLIIAPKDYFRA